MKKLVLFVMAVMAFAGMSVAQDVYTTGYYTESDHTTTTAAVYKNGTELYHLWGSANDRYSPAVLCNANGDVFWPVNAIGSGDIYQKACVRKNDQMYLELYDTPGSHINDICTDGFNLYSVGCMTYQGSRTAAVWFNDIATPDYQLGVTFYNSEALGCCCSPDGRLFTVGYQYTDVNSTTYHGVVWEDGDIYFELPEGTMICDVAFLADHVYIVGRAYEDNQYKLVVWEDDYELYTLYTSSIGFVTDRIRLYVDETGDIYVSSYGGGDDKVWKNGEECFTTPGYITDVAANSDGVYCTGSNNGIAKVWKDGNELYSNDGCSRFTGIFVEEPTCTNSEARTLPYFEGFETGATDWVCWTKIDGDGQNGTDESYWHRGGDFHTDIIHYDSDYCAWHSYNGSDYQDGWLISPVISIPEGSTAKLTFQSYERYPDYYGYEGVWVNPLTTAEEVWHPTFDEVSDEWKTIEIDLSAYQGQDIVLGFKYTGLDAHNWYIDDVSVTEETAPVMYTLTLNAFPPEGGQVSADPAGPYHYGDMVTLTATPNTGYAFVSWQDGSTDAMRTVEVTGDATYNAIFTQGGTTMYTVNVVSENPLLGSVTGGGTFPAGTVIEIGATPSPSARFVSWDDGNTDNPRTVTVTGNITYTAKFEALQNYTITVVSANPAMGTVEGSGTFMEGTVINISATPLTGYYFIGWSDGNADNPRSITVTANETYVAQFGTNPVQTFTLTVMCNSSEGTTIGSGTYTAGSTATIAAFPNSGYLFDKWQDNVTDNPRQVTVTGDMTFVAFFKSTGVGENEGRLLVLYPNPANDYIRIEGLEANSEVKIYNTMGALVKVVNVNANEEIGISELSDGLYVLRCGNATLRFVKK